MIEGLDVAHWDVVTDWSKVKASGRSFVFMKVSQGHTKDPKYDHYRAGAQAVGLLVGPYCYLASGVDGRAQAQFFVSSMGELEGMLPPVADVEERGAMSVSAYSRMVLDFLDEVEKLTGVRPIVYANHDYSINQLSGQAFSVYDEWIAWYRTSPPQKQIGVFYGWRFWQYSDSGRIPGISGNVDLDRFDGTLEELQSLVVGSVQPKDIEVVLPDGTVCDCQPAWVGDRITVKAEPLLAALGQPENNPAVHVNTGRAYVGAPDGLADSGIPFEFDYVDQPQGPRVYVKPKPAENVGNASPTLPELSEPNKPKKPRAKKPKVAP
jgi:lysozyme